MNMFEMVIDGKTYTTKKMTPALRGRIIQVMAHMMKASDGIPASELLNDKNYPEWLSVMISGKLWEHVPAVMWDFIHPEDKTKIGTQESFQDALTDELISNFFAWASNAIKEASEQVKKTPTTEESESPSTTSKTSSVENTDGAEITSNPSAN